MKWYYEVLGGHTHVRVFMNGGKCGDLCFRNEEFNQIAIELGHSTGAVQFIQEDPRRREMLNELERKTKHE